VRRDQETQPLPASDYIRTRWMPADRPPTATLQTCTNGRGATTTRQEWASPCVQDGIGRRSAAGCDVKGGCEAALVSRLGTSDLSWPQFYLGAPSSSPLHVLDARHIVLPRAHVPFFEPTHPRPSPKHPIRYLHCYLRLHRALGTRRPRHAPPRCLPASAPRARWR